MMTKVADIPYAITEIYSQKILRDALPKMYFRSLVDYKLEFGVQKGNTIRFPKQNWLVGGSAIINEETPIGLENLAGSDKLITMGEMGHGVSISRMAEESAHIAIMEEARTLIANHYAWQLDLKLRDTFFATANKFYAKADSTSGAVIGDTASLLTAKVIDSILEKASDLNIPKFKGPSYEYYVMVCDSHTIRQLRAEAGGRWQSARIYTDPSDIKYGTAGMYEGIIFIEAPTMKEKLAVGAGAGAKDVHKSLFIGAGAVGFGESVPMSIYQLVEKEPFRKTSLAWYSINGAGILMDNIIEVNTIDGIPA